MGIFWAYIAFIIIGFYLASRFLHFRKKYFWFEYLAIFLIPSLVLFMMYLSLGLKIIVAFLLFCLIGPLAEIMVGMLYYKVFGKHLWIYEKFPICNRTTSLLSIPFWGFVCVVMYMMQQLVFFIFK